MVVASKHERGVVVRNEGVVVGENLAYPSRIHAAGVCLAFVCQSAGAAIKWTVVAKKTLRLAIERGVSRRIETKVM